MQIDREMKLDAFEQQFWKKNWVCALFCFLKNRIVLSVPATPASLTGNVQILILILDVQISDQGLSEISMQSTVQTRDCSDMAVQFHNGSSSAILCLSLHITDTISHWTIQVLLQHHYK